MTQISCIYSLCSSEDGVLRFPVMSYLQNNNTQYEILSKTVHYNWSSCNQPKQCITEAPHYILTALCDKCVCQPFKQTSGCIPIVKGDISHLNPSFSHLGSIYSGTAMMRSDFLLKVTPLSSFSPFVRCVLKQLILKLFL